MAKDEKKNVNLRLTVDQKELLSELVNAIPTAQNRAGAVIIAARITHRLLAHLAEGCEIQCKPASGPARRIDIGELVP